MNPTTTMINNTTIDNAASVSPDRTGDGEISILRIPREAALVCSRCGDSICQMQLEFGVEVRSGRSKHNPQENRPGQQRLLEATGVTPWKQPETRSYQQVSEQTRTRMDWPWFIRRWGKSSADACKNRLKHPRISRWSAFRLNSTLTGTFFNSTSLLRTIPEQAP